MANIIQNLTKNRKRVDGVLKILNLGLKVGTDKSTELCPTSENNILSDVNAFKCHTPSIKFF